MPHSPRDHGRTARALTEPLRELCALALLLGNAVFLLLGVTGLLFVIDGWASGFGARSAAVFGQFVGLYALALPMAALLLATHVRPMLRHARFIMIAVLVEYGVSALFGAISFLGAFAFDLDSARATIEGLLFRGVWLGFLVLACILAVRVWLGLFPATPPTYAPTYGRPYPGQPMHPQQPAAGAPPLERYQPPAGAETQRVPAPSTNGWPVVPPPPQPEPLVLDADPTMRISLPRPADVLGGEQTQIVPPPGAPPAPAPEPPAAAPTPPAEPPAASPAPPADPDAPTGRMPA